MYPRVVKPRVQSLNFGGSAKWVLNRDLGNLDCMSARVHVEFVNGESGDKEASLVPL